MPGQKPLLKFHLSIILGLLIYGGTSMSLSTRAQSILINEIMSSNGAFVSDFEGSFPDWIELYNITNQSIDLTGYILSDRENEAKWSFPQVEIGASDYLVVFASDKNTSVQGEYHTNFKLSSTGESVFLYDPNFNLIDRLDFPEMSTDESYGRSCDPAMSIGFFQTPTFNESNCNETISPSNGTVSFSIQGGFYEKEIILELECNDLGAEVRYTLDHTLPDLSASLYTDPLVLSDKTQEPNIYVNIQTTPEPHDTLEYLVPKFNVVRAGCFSEGKLLDEVKTESYLISSEAKSEYSLPVISLVTGPDNLFSDATGIYVPGSSAGGVPNYERRGRGWERSVHLEYFSPDGERLLAQDAGLRIQGGTTRVLQNKSLRLYARSEYGKSRFSYKFFENTDLTTFKRLILRNSGQDHGATFFRDALIHEILRETTLDVQAYSPVILFINGEYWGVSNLRERQDEHYLAAYYNLDAEQATVVGFGGQDLIDYAINHDMSLTSNFKAMSEKMDMMNFIRLSIADNFFYRWDYANRTTWETTEENKRHFFLYDMDVGLGGFDTGDKPWTFNYFLYMVDPFDPEVDRHAAYSNHVAWLYRELMKNEEFRNLFIETYLSYLKSIFAFSNAIPKLNQIRNRLAPEMEDHIERWGRPVSLLRWESEVSRVREFIRQRPCVVYRQLSDLFDVRDEELENLDCDALVVGLKDSQTLPLTIYPNPSTGMLSVTLDKVSTGKFFVKVFNTGGQLVHSESGWSTSAQLNYQIKLPRLPVGEYFVTFSGSIRRSARIILE